MKRYIYNWLIGLGCSLVSMAAVAQEVAKPETPDWESMEQVAESAFTIYRHEGKIYWAVPDEWVGREVEIRAQIDKGFDCLNRPAEALGVVRLQKTDDGHIAFRQENYNERMLLPAPWPEEAFRLSNRRPAAEKTYRIIGHTAKGSVIDITQPLTQGDDWYRYHMQQIGPLDGASARVIQVRGGKDAVSFTISRRHRFTEDKEMQVSYIMMLPSGTLPLEVSCTLRLLPEQDMPIRLATKQKAFRTLPFTDYSQDAYAAVTDSLALRWRTEAPLIFYIDSLFPDTYLPAVERAVKAWNKAFEKAGFRQMLTTRRADRQAVMAVQRAVVSYDLVQPGVQSHLTFHPRTGEILSCHINVGHGFLGERLEHLFLQGVQADKHLASNLDSELLATAILESELKRAIGETLGLCNRTDGRSAYTMEQIKTASFVKKHSYTASIMDHRLPYHYAATQEDGLSAKQLLPDVGRYDEEAIVWGYKKHSGCKNCLQDREKGYAYLTHSPRATLSVNVGLSSEPLKALNYALANLSATLQQLDELLPPNQQHRCSRLYNKGVSLYGDYLKEVVTCMEQASEAERQQTLQLLDSYLLKEDKMDCPGLRRSMKLYDMWQTKKAVLDNTFTALFQGIKKQKIDASVCGELCRMLLGDEAADVSLSPYRMEIIHLLVNRCLEACKEQADAPLGVMAALRQLDATLGGRESYDKETTAFYELIRKRLRQSGLCRYR